MFRQLKSFFHPFRLRRPQDPQINPMDDQINLRDANQAPPTPSERCVGTDAENSSRVSQFLELAAKLRPSFPPACSWLDPTDLQDIEEPPVDGGRFANVWRGRLEDREVAIKSYRCYVCFDCDQVRMVSRNKYRYDLHGYI